MTYFATNYSATIRVFTYGPYAMKSEPRVLIFREAERPRDRQGL